MTRLLRVVDGARWDFVDDLPDWKAKGDLPGAAIGDLRPSATNKLSFWAIEADNSNLDRIIGALAASRGNIESFEARMVDLAEVQALFTVKQSNGQSKDSEANKTWHRDLVDVTYAKLGGLVELLATKSIPIERDETEVIKLILDSVKAGHIKIESLEPAKQS